MLEAAHDLTRFLRQNGRWISGGFLLTLFSCFGQTFFIGLSGNDLRARHELSGGEFGSIYMAATLASALALPWLGRTLDLMPGWKVTRFVMPCVAIACVLLAIAPNVWALVVALFLLRLFGQGMMTEIAFTEVGRWFAANRGRAMALVSMGMQAGSALFPPAFVLIHSGVGWQAAWLGAAAITFLSTPPLLRLMSVERNPQSELTRSQSSRTARDWTRAQVLRDPILYVLLIGTLAPPFIVTTVFFHQGYLIELRGYDPLAFAAAFSVMAVTTVIFSLVAGHWIDRFGALRMLPSLLVPLIVATMAAAVITPLWGIYLFMFLLGISNGLTATLLGSLWPEVYGLANLGGIRAITISAAVVSTALGPGITGVLIDHGIGLPTQLLWMSAWSAIASFALAFAARQVREREAAHQAWQGALD